MISLNFVEVKQPIGSFYICSIEASLLINIVEIRRRNISQSHVQRDDASKRVSEISNFCSDKDAVFPTPIIVAVDIDSNVRITDGKIHFSGDEIIGEVIDGQHRILGIKKSGLADIFQLPVVFMFDLELTHKAYIFSIINSKQTRVNMSLIYDLFALSEFRSPYKTCHELARSFNNDFESPYYNRMKMLGKKTETQENASISQGSFIKFTLELITRDPESDTRNLKKGVDYLKSDLRCPLREYFIEENDAVIYKILMNYLNSVRAVFGKEWNDPHNYIISKSIGYSALVKAFPTFYQLGVSKGALNFDFFLEVMNQIKSHMENLGKSFTSNDYGSNEQSRAQLTRDLTAPFN